MVLETVDKRSFSDYMKVLKEGDRYVNVTAPLPGPPGLVVMMRVGKRVNLDENLLCDLKDLLFIKELVDTEASKVVINRK